MRRLFVAAVVAVSAAIAVVASSAPATKPSPSPFPAVYSQASLERARLITQDLSTSGSPSTRDYQLVIGSELRGVSTDEFATALVAYEHQVDRMLARTP